jgi:formylglycine-generating enzyme required for sulfatase activity
LEVTGGTYARAYTVNADGGITVPNGADCAAYPGACEGYPATVSSFKLDKYEVTVGRFRQFVNAWNGGAGWMPPAGSGKHTHLNKGNGLTANVGGYEPGWVVADDGVFAPGGGFPDSLLECPQSPSPYATWTALAGSQENLPINCVNWFVAYAFCIWDGGFLPSEAEWEYAASGGSQQREYPWGSTEPGTSNRYAIYSDGYGTCYYPIGTLMPCVGTGNIAPVGYTILGAGLWGQLDLAGNVSEWTLDWSKVPDTEFLYTDPWTDCVNLYSAQPYFRVFRGGSFQNVQSFLLSASRMSDTPALGFTDVGVRCARTP